MRIIIDTNVLVSAIFFNGGLPKDILDLVELGKIKHIASQEIIQEYKDTFARIAIREERYDKAVALNKFIPKIEIIKTTTNLQICRDPDDDKFINCAIDGKCKYIVSGDKDLLVLENVENVEIITIRDFMEEYKKTIEN